MNTLERLIRHFAPTAMLMLVSAAVLSAQQLTVTPNTLTFSAQAGGSVTPSQAVTITSPSSVAVSATLIFPSWIQVSPLQATTPATFQISVNPATIIALPQSGFVQFNGGAAQVLITVNATGGGGGGSILAANPTSLTFTSQAGVVPPTQSLTLTTTSGASVSFTYSAVTTIGFGWLSMAPQSAVTPAIVVVSVNPTGLSAGVTYTGYLAFTPLGGTGTLQVPVQYTVGGTPQLNVSPSSVYFYYQLGTASTPATQVLALTSSGTSLQFSLTYGTVSGGQWLFVSPISGATPANLQVGVISGAIPQVEGTYTGSIVIYAPGASNPSQTVQVNLLVSRNPLLTSTPASLSFTMSAGAGLPAAQTLSLNSSGVALSFSATASTTPLGANWLTLSPLAGSTPTSVSVSINGAALSLTSGTYNGSITFTAPGAGNNPLTVPVTLAVTNNPVVSAFPGALTFNFQTNQAAPNPQSLTVSSTGTPTTFTTTASVTTPLGGAWLAVYPQMGTTSSSPNVSVTVNPAGVPVGQSNGAVVVTPTGAGLTPFNVPVTLNVSNTALLNVSPGALAFTFTGGSTTPITQYLSLTSTDPANQLNFNVFATANPGVPLQIGPVTGVTGATVQVTVSPLGLAPGVYTGSIRVQQASGANPQDVPVTVTVNTGATLSVSPTSLSFSQTTGGGAPAAQSLSVSSTISSVNFTAVATTTIGVNWLSVTPASGATPGSLSVSVNGATLNAGTYFGTITVTAPGAAGSPQNIPVTLTISTAPTITAAPSSLAFSYQITGTVPSTQTFSVTSSGAAVNVSASASTSNGGSWLAVSPASGTTPATFTVSINPSSLTTAGSYSGTISVTGQGAANSPLSVGVTLTVTSPPAGSLTKILNAASYLAAALSPGEIIYLGGTNIGPATGVSFSLTASGAVPASLGGVQVVFDGLPAPMIYASSGQVNAIVPFEVAGRLSTNVVVSYNGVQSNTLVMQVAATAPGIFTVNLAGTGQGAILNQNNSVNAPSNPAAKGSVVQVFGTGEGQESPPGVTGGVNGSTLRLPLQQPVTATVGGVPATVQYAGSAPGLIAGVFQVNVVIPPGAPSGSLPIVIAFGTSSSTQANVTVAVQ